MRWDRFLRPPARTISPSAAAPRAGCCAALPPRRRCSPRWRSSPGFVSTCSPRPVSAPRNCVTRPKPRSRGFPASRSTPCWGRRAYRSIARNCLPSRFPTSASGPGREERPCSRPGKVDFGIRALPLLSGSVQLGSARVSDARIYAQAFGSGGGADWTAALKNSDGLIDPDQVSSVVFDAVRRMFEAFDVGSTRSIELDNVEVVLAGRRRRRQSQHRQCDADAG